MYYLRLREYSGKSLTMKDTTGNTHGGNCMNKDYFKAREGMPEAETPQQWILQRPGLVAAMASQGAEGARSALRIAETLMAADKPKI